MYLHSKSFNFNYNVCNIIMILISFEYNIFKFIQHNVILESNNRLVLAILKILKYLKQYFVRYFYEYSYRYIYIVYTFHIDYAFQ
jgi:hypothetical protein